MQQQFSRLLKSMIIYGVGSGINQFLLFLLLPLFTNYLTPKDYGISSILALISLFVISIFSLGFGSAITPIYFEAKDLAHRGATIWTAFIFLLGSISVLIILGTTFSSTISILGFRTSEYHHLITLTFLTASLSIIKMPFALYPQFEERATLFAILTLASSLLATGISVLMVVVLRRGILGWVEGGLIAGLITLIIFMVPVLGNLKFQFNLKLGRDLMRMGIPIIPSFAFLFVMQQTSYYILQWFHGLEVLGVYSIGISFGMVMGLAVGAFTTAWTPFFMSYFDRREEARILFGRILTYYVFGFGSLTLLFFIFARPVTMLMTQPAFHDAYKVVGFAAMAQAFIGVYSILLPGMYFAKEIYAQVIIQTGASLITVGSAFLLIPAFKAPGAALSLVSGYLAMTVFTGLWNWIRRHEYVTIQYEWSRILIFILISIIYIIGTFAISGLSFYASLAASIAGIIGLMFALYAILNRVERQVIKMFLFKPKENVTEADRSTH